MMKICEKLYLSTILHFGKYSGTSIYDLILDDIKYADWLIETVYRGNVDNKVRLMFNEYWERRNHKIHGFRNDHLNKKR